LPANSDARLREVELLKQQGIPTVYIDRDVGGARVSVVKTDNALAGRLAAQAMLKELNGKGNIAVLGYKKGILTTGVLQAAFIYAAIGGGLKIKVNEFLSTRVGEARVKAFDILNNEENIDAIFTANEITTVATILALRKTDKLGK
jgi:ribose transport system substrate-binding protein